MEPFSNFRCGRTPSPRLPRLTTPLEVTANQRRLDQRPQIGDSPREWYSGFRFTTRSRYQEGGALIHSDLPGGARCHHYGTPPVAPHEAAVARATRVEAKRVGSGFMAGSFETVEKTAREYARQSHIGARVRGTHVALSVCAALGAIFCAITGRHSVDRFLSSMVLVLLLFEVLVYGIQHSRKNWQTERAYRTVAEDAKNRRGTEAELDQRLAALGLPDIDPLVRAAGTRANSLAWDDADAER